MWSNSVFVAALFAACSGLAFAAENDNEQSGRPVATPAKDSVGELTLSGKRYRPEIQRGFSAFAGTKSYGAFHEFLTRMEEMGLVARHDTPGEQRGSLYRRQVYSVTAAGENALKQAAIFYLSDLGNPVGRRAA